MVFPNMNLVPFSPKITSSSEKPKFLIIELEQIDNWIDELQKQLEYDIKLMEIISLFLTSFKSRHEAMLNLEYSLLEICANNEYFSHASHNVRLDDMLNAYRIFGLRLLQQLEMFNCFKNDKLEYDFGKIINDTTFVLWRPNQQDIYHE